MEKIIPEVTEIDSSNLLLDMKNPRIPESVAFSKETNSQEAIMKFIKKTYDVEELASSISENGYFRAEPLVTIPEKEFENYDKNKYEEYLRNKESKFIVVEGNRRLTAIKLLLRGESEHDISDELRKQFEKLPVVVYPNRKEVLAFLGVRHLAGVRKWDVYERACFIVSLKRDKKIPIEKIQKIIGDRKNSAKKTYVCYRLIEIVDEFNESFGIEDAKDNFSFLQLATGQQNIKDYIGLPSFKNMKDVDNPIPKDKREKLIFLFQYLFDSEGGRKKALIEESRDITKRLQKILGDEQATKELEKSENIDSAYQMIGGDIAALENLSREAKNILKSINGTLPEIEPSRINEKNDFKKNFKVIKRIVEDIESKLNKK